MIKLNKLDKVLKEEIRRVEEKEREETLQHKQRLEKMKQESLSLEQRAVRWLQYTRKAKAENYAEWLQGWIYNGGKISHTYDYNIPANFIVLERDSVITPLYGSSCQNIIVPLGVKATVEALGHNKVFIMEDFRPIGDWIPLYKDVKEILAG